MLSTLFLNESRVTQRRRQGQQEQNSSFRSSFRRHTSNAKTFSQQLHSAQESAKPQLENK